MHEKQVHFFAYTLHTRSAAVQPQLQRTAKDIPQCPKTQKKHITHASFFIVHFLLLRNYFICVFRLSVSSCVELLFFPTSYFTCAVFGYTLNIFGLVRLAMVVVRFCSSKMRFSETMSIVFRFWYGRPAFGYGIHRPGHQIYKHYAQNYEF